MHSTVSQRIASSALQRLDAKPTAMSGRENSHLRWPARTGRSCAYWWLQGSFYSTDEELTDGDVRAVLLAREVRKRRSVERAHALTTPDAAVSSASNRSGRTGWIELCPESSGALRRVQSAEERQSVVTARRSPQRLGLVRSRFPREAWAQHLLCAHVIAEPAWRVYVGLPTNVPALAGTAATSSPAVTMTPTSAGLSLALNMVRPLSRVGRVYADMTPSTARRLAAWAPAAGTHSGTAR